MQLALSDVSYADNECKRGVGWAFCGAAAEAEPLNAVMDRLATREDQHGSGMGRADAIFTASLPSTLAELPKSDVAVATGSYSFVRSFGLVRGVTVASVAFNGQVNTNLQTVSDPAVRKLLQGGGAYTYAAEGSRGLATLSKLARGEDLGVYDEALSAVWLICVGVSCLGFVVTFFERSIKLRKEQTTEFGLVKDGAANTWERAFGLASRGVILTIRTIGGV